MKSHDVLDTLATRLLGEEIPDEAQLTKIFGVIHKRGERPV